MGFWKHEESLYHLYLISFQVPNGKVLIWSMYKKDNIIYVTCNHKVMYKFDYKDRRCEDKYYEDFKPKIEFREGYDDASFMYKVIGKMAS